MDITLQSVSHLGVLESYRGLVPRGDYVAWISVHNSGVVPTIFGPVRCMVLFLHLYLRHGLMTLSAVEHWDEAKVPRCNRIWEVKLHRPKWQDTA